MPAKYSTPKLCSFPGCGRGHKGHDLCKTHLRQQREGGVVRNIEPRVRGGNGRTSARTVAMGRLAYQTWRQSVFQRDGFTCQLCDHRGRGLEANHIRRWADAPLLRYHVGNGITLCCECHRAIRGKESEWEHRFTDIVRGKPIRPLNDEQLASLQPVYVACRNCGQVLRRPQSLAKGNVYCNRECQSKGRYCDYAAHVARGEGNVNAKLTDEIVRAAKAARAAGEGVRAIARRLGVDHRTIGRAIRGESWRHVA